MHNYEEYSYCCNIPDVPQKTAVNIEILDNRPDELTQVGDILKIVGSSNSGDRLLYCFHRAFFTLLSVHFVGKTE
jgi:hypothetical protein